MQEFSWRILLFQYLCSKILSDLTRFKWLFSLSPGKAWGMEIAASCTVVFSGKKKKIHHQKKQPATKWNQCWNYKEEFICLYVYRLEPELFKAEHSPLQNFIFNRQQKTSRWKSDQKVLKTKNNINKGCEKAKTFKSNFLEISMKVHFDFTIKMELFFFPTVYSTHVKLRKEANLTCIVRGLPGVFFIQNKSNSLWVKHWDPMPLTTLEV